MFKYQLRSAVGMPGHMDKGLGTPTQKRISLIDTSGSDVSGQHFVRANDALSRMNNRLYRQLRNYELSFTFVPENNANALQTLRFYTLPDTWFVRGAIKYAYETYMQCMADELNAGIKMAKWHDFSINEQDPDGTWGATGAVLFDGDSFGAIGIDESITDSTVTDSGGQAEGFHLFGTISNSHNIFTEYAKRLNYTVSDDESVSSDQPYDGLLDLDDADVLAERGDRAPYDRDFSGWTKPMVLQDVLVYDGDAHQGKLSTKRFTAPLGMVWVTRHVGASGTDLDASAPELIMNVAPGTYKGVNAPSLV